MVGGDAFGLLVGAVILGAIHGIEPGHGWPVAASYALDQSNKWLYGLLASLIIGVGHLISSIAMVAVFFYAKSYFNLTQVNEPIILFDTIQLGGPVSLVAGILLIALGIREYFHDHSHGNHNDRAHASPQHEEHDYDHSRDHTGKEVVSRLKGGIPFVGTHSHSHDNAPETTDRGLFGIA